MHVWCEGDCVLPCCMILRPKSHRFTWWQQYLGLVYHQSSLIFSFFFFLVTLNKKDWTPVLKGKEICHILLWSCSWWEMHSLLLSSLHCPYLALEYWRCWKVWNPSQWAQWLKITIYLPDTIQVLSLWTLGSEGCAQSCCRWQWKGHRWNELVSDIPLHLLAQQNPLQQMPDHCGENYVISIWSAVAVNFCDFQNGSFHK